MAKEDSKRKIKSKKNTRKGELYHNGEPKPTEISARLRDINENITDIHTNSFFLHHDNFLPLSRDGQRKKTQENGKKKSKYQKVNKARKLHGDLIIKARLE